MTRTELIAALEAAPGPSRELDAQIAVLLRDVRQGAQIEILPEPDFDGLPMLKLPALEDKCEKGTYWLVAKSGWALRSSPFYTKSIDAALSFTPEGAEISLTNLYGLPTADVGLNFDTHSQAGRGATLAIALCIANLRALEAQEKA